MHHVESGKYRSGRFGVGVAVPVLLLVASTLLIPAAGAQERVESKDVALHSDNGHAQGIWSDGTTMWVADASDDKVYAYRLSDGARQTDKEFDLASLPDTVPDDDPQRDTDDNDAPRGIWSDGATMWVADGRDLKVYAYRLSDGVRQTDEEFALDGISRTDGIGGIWSDGTVLWALAVSPAKIFAYRLSDGLRQLTRDIGRLDPSGFENLHGIWSDGTVLWVVDIESGDSDVLSDVHAYRLSDSFPLPGYNFRFRLNTAEDFAAVFMWSDGETAWITRPAGKQIDAYRLPALPDGWAAPEAPDRVWAIPRDGAAQVNWQRSPSGDIATDGYVAVASPGGATCSTSDGYVRRGRSGVWREAPHYCDISRLENGVSYTFTVISYDEWGTSAPSAASEAVRPPGGNSDPPQRVRATAGDRSVSVSWDPPADDGGSPVSGYTAVSSPHSRRCHTYTADPDPDLTCDISGLTNGVRYTFTVTARNHFGTSGPSVASRSVAPTGADAPWAPTEVQAQPANDGTISLTWTAPQYRGDSPISAYNATATPTNTSFPTRTCTTTSRECVFSQLFNDMDETTDYAFTVSATNRNGTSPLASPVANVTPCTYTPPELATGDNSPDPPTRVDTSPQPNAAVVRWTKPSTLNTLDYTATADPCGRTCTTRKSTCTIRGLTNGVEYTITVVARYRGHHSSVATAYSSITPPWEGGL